MKRCFECAYGDHDNYDENVKLVTVFDPETHKIHIRGYLCGEHRTAYQDDGYLVK